MQSYYMWPSNPRPKKLLDQVRDVIRVKHYSYRTEQTYVQWIYRYIMFHNKRHPNEMGVAEIEAFLTDLPVNRHVAASTQNQALSALLFLYRDVLQQLLDERVNAIRAKKPRRLPTVLTSEECRNIIQNMFGVHLWDTESVGQLRNSLERSLTQSIYSVSFDANFGVGSQDTLKY